MKAKTMTMTVYLYNNLVEMKEVDVSNCNQIIVDTNSIPRINDKVYFPHHGTYIVMDVTYHCSDDTPLGRGYNELTFVSVDAVKIK